MANFEVLSLDPTTPQIRAPGAGDGYSVPRDMTFATGTTLNAPTTVVSVNTSTDALRITQVGSGNALVVEDSANPDATPTVVTATGAVGIGTASPTQSLHVEGGNARINRSSDATILFLGGSPSANWEGDIQFVTSNTATNWRLSSNRGAAGAFAITPSTAGGGSTFTTPAFLISSAGNVGIGTTSPTHRLTIGSGSYGQAAASSTTGMYTTATGLEMLSDSYYFGNRSGTNLAFLNSSGNLGLGVTPSAWGSAYKNIDINTYAAVGSTTGVFALKANAFFDGTSDKYKNSAAASQYYQSAGAHVWATALSGTAGNAITFTQAMTLDASGNLMVGATSAVGRFTLQDTGTTTEITLRSSGGVGNNNRARIIGGYESGGSDYGGYLAFNTTSTSNVNGERARIDSSGNFKVGTTSFGTRVAISGTNAATGTTVNGSVEGMLLLRTTSSDANAGPEIAFASGYDGGGVFSITGATIKSYKVPGAGTGADQYDHGLIFKTSNSTTLSVTEKARITPAGEFLVGTTNTSPSANVGAKIYPAGSMRCVNADSANTTENWSMYSTGAANYRFYVGWGGTVYATNTTISAISDQRYKENIRDLDVGLDAILALKPRKFDWKAGQGKDIKDDRGFIAQEFEQVFPDLVDEWKDPAPEGEEPYKSVRQDLIPVLVKAMQEQQAMIEELKAKVAALEAR